MRRKRVLIANRGEIAVRIIKACEENDIETVLVVSEADQDSLPARLADKVVCIGPPQVNLSYLNIPMIIATAQPPSICVTLTAIGSKCSMSLQVAFLPINQE